VGSGFHCLRSLFFLEVMTWNFVHHHGCDCVLTRCLPLFVAGSVFLIHASSVYMTCILFFFSVRLPAFLTREETQYKEKRLAGSSKIYINKGPSYGVRIIAYADVDSAGNLADQGFYL